jgi:hypothetical protein
LAEFWHWFVANIPGDSLDDGEVVFDLLFPLVLPDGNGDHRSVLGSILKTVSAVYFSRIFRPEFS